MKHLIMATKSGLMKIMGGRHRDAGDRSIQLTSIHRSSDRVYRDSQFSKIMGRLHWPSRETEKR